MQWRLTMYYQRSRPKDDSICSLIPTECWATPQICGATTELSYGVVVIAKDYRAWFRDWRESKRARSIDDRGRPAAKHVIFGARATSICSLSSCSWCKSSRIDREDTKLTWKANQQERRKYYVPRWTWHEVVSRRAWRIPSVSGI